MADQINWGMITDGVTFQSLAAKLIYFQDITARLFDRPGKDAGIDILSGDGKTVYQAKYRKDNSFDNICSIAKKELENIKKYKNGSGYEHDCWIGVKNWIIISNFEVNPNDNVKWKTVSAEFEKEGIKADYWNLLKLEAELNKFPVIISEYFSGKNRVFLSVVEEDAALRNEAQFAETLDIPYIGHSKELSLFENFLVSNEKRILPVIGEGGVGKTRFLLEIAKQTSYKPIQVLWANVETMTCSDDWINAINPSAETLVIIDEPDNVSLLRKVIEHIRADKWKAVIALRSAKQFLIKEMRLMQAKYINDPIILATMPKDEAKDFIRKFLSKLSIQITDPPQDVFIENLIQYTAGNPTWICIALNNIRNKPQNALLHNIDEIAKHYMDEIIVGMKDICPPDQVRKLFFYLALFRKVNIEKKIIRDFLYDSTGVDDGCDIISILNELKRRRFLINYGCNNRYYAIKPDLICDYILKRELLTDSNPTRITRTGENIINNVLTGKIPFISEIISNLARIDVQNDTHILTERIFSAIRQLLDDEKTTAMQLRVVALIKKVQFANLRVAVEIYDYIFNTQYPLSHVEYKIRGEICIDHNYVKRKIIWELYCISEHLYEANDQDIAIKIFYILCKTYRNEFLRDKLPNDGKNAKDLISRILKNEIEFILFSVCAFTYLKESLPLIDSLRPEDISLFECVARSFLSIEREKDYLSEHCFHITRYTLAKESLLLQKEQEIIDAIKEKIASELAVEPKKHLIEIIDHVYHDRNRVRLQDKSSEQEECEIAQWKQDLLQWVKEIIQTFSADQQILKTAMRDIWKWDLKYGEGELQTLARECEDIFLQDKRVSLLQQLCDWDRHEEYSHISEEVIALYSYNFNDIIKIIKNIRNEHDNDPLRIIAPNVAKKYFQITIIEPQTLDLLSSGDTTERKFGIDIVVNVLNMLRESCDERYEQFWMHVLNQIQDAYKYELFYALYSDGRPFQKCPFSDFDWMQLKMNADVFPYKFQLFYCVAALGFLNWERVIDFLEEQWETIQDFTERQNCLFYFKHNLYLYYLIKPNDVSQAQIAISFIFKHSGEVLDPSNIFDYKFEHLLKSCSKQSFSWFIDFLRKRIIMEQEIDSKKYPAFKILPYEFFPHKWTDYSSAMEAEIYDFLSLCEIPTFINFDLPRLVVDLDLSGEKAKPILIKKIQEYIQNNNLDSLKKWARLVSLYPTDTTIWRDCAQIICSYAATLPTADRNRIYSNLSPHKIETFCCSPGEIPPIYLEKLSFAQKQLTNETDSNIKAYWQYLEKIAKSTIEYERGRIEEEEEL